MWKVCVPPLLTTKVQASTVCIKAPCKEIVPRQVCDISAGFLKQRKRRRDSLRNTSLGRLSEIAEWHREKQTWVLSFFFGGFSKIIHSISFKNCVKVYPSDLPAKQQIWHTNVMIVCVNLWHCVTYRKSVSPWKRADERGGGGGEERSLLRRTRKRNEFISVIGKKRTIWLSNSHYHPATIPTTLTRMLQQSLSNRETLRTRNVSQEQFVVRSNNSNKNKWKRVGGKQRGGEPSIESCTWGHSRFVKQHATIMIPCGKRKKVMVTHSESYVCIIGEKTSCIFIFQRW